ncbi:MAG: OmpA family protein, partial [Ignavibacteria bacterium]|nr:OmpA family protein [Ignavibacteria bacterium]
MKHFIILTLIALSILGHQPLKAQKIDIKKKIDREINQRSNKKVDNTIDKGFDKIEKGIDGIFEKKPEKKDKDEETELPTESEKVKKTDETKVDDQTKVEVLPQEGNSPQLVWSKYDFVPGTEIIFEDNQEGELNGEFPSKWDLAGGLIENANFDGTNVIMFRKCNINGIDGIVPLLKNAKEDYLPEEFTIEFDAYFESPLFTYRLLLL